MPTPTPTPYREIYPITFGRSNKNAYQNEYFNVKLDLNEKWFAKSSAELDEMSGFSTRVPNVIRDEEYLDRLAKGDPIEDYDAQLLTGLKEISIAIVTVKDTMTDFDSVEAYHDEIIGRMRDGFIEEGAIMMRDEHTTAMFAGQEQSCWFFSYEGGGYVTYSAQIVLQKGDYSLNVVVTSIAEDQTEDLLAMFLPMYE
ncbi:MAG: hypothetical protein C0413_01830 [Clostridiales bacterium]|nr:hypothetical protein [Clostridiales bacterium]